MTNGSMDLIRGAILNQEFRGPTEVFAFHKTICDGTTNTFAGLLFVTIVASTVEETVANFDSVVNNLQTRVNEHSQPVVTFGLTSAQVALGI